MEQSGENECSWPAGRAWGGLWSETGHGFCLGRGEHEGAIKRQPHRVHLRAPCLPFIAPAVCERRTGQAPLRTRIPLTEFLLEVGEEFRDSVNQLLRCTDVDATDAVLQRCDAKWLRLPPTIFWRGEIELQ